MSSGKKVALWGCFGCAGIIVLLVIILAGGFGFVAFKGYRFSQELGETYQEIGVGYRELDQQHPYTPPADQQMEAERINALLNVRADMAKFTQATFSRLEQTGQEIEGQFERPGIRSKITGIGKIKEIVQIAANMAADIGNKHIEGLKAHNMPPSEYKWLMATYLGTMSKADAVEYQDLNSLWQKYLAAFDKSQKKISEFNMNTGRTSINGDDMNKRELIRSIEHIEFSHHNAQIVRDTADLLFPTEEVTILDFLSLQLDNITNMGTSRYEAPQEVEGFELPVPVEEVEQLH
jgi:hypothetical protein